MANRVRYFNTAGADSWVCPPGVTVAIVECYGGGGAGANRNSNGAGGGGGGGAYARNNNFTCTPGTSYSLTVGAGGNTNNNANGTNSSFNNGTVRSTFGITAPRNNATGAAGGNSGNSVGEVVYNGGAGAAGASNNGGGGGSSAGTGAVGRAGQGNVGGGNGSDSANLPAGAGAGGNGAKTASAVGTNGVEPGGAGGGAARNNTTNRSGGNGAAGRVIVTYTIPLIGNFTDNFDDNNLSPNWAASNGAQVKEQNGEIEITTTLAGGYWNIQTIEEGYDLVGSSVTIKLIDVGNQALASLQVLFGMNSYDGTQTIQWSIKGNEIVAYWYMAGHSPDEYNYPRAAVAFDIAVFKYLRIREASGTIYWDYSADGINWTNFTSEATDLTTLGSMQPT